MSLCVSVPKPFASVYSRTVKPLTTFSAARSQKMKFNIEKQKLVEKYKRQRTLRKTAIDTEFWVYPYEYYKELVDLVIKHRNW